MLEEDGLENYIKTMRILGISSTIVQGTPIKTCSVFILSRYGRPKADALSVHACMHMPGPRAH